MDISKKVRFAAVILSIALFMSVPNAFSEEKSLPSVYAVSTFGVGSSGYVTISAAAPSLEKSLDAKLRLVPSDVRLSQYKMLQIGDVHWVHTHLGSAYRPLFGLEEFATKDWGPQRFTMLYKGGNLILTVFVREKSSIKTIKDLKGKRCAIYPGSEIFWNSMLAYANLSLDSVVMVPAGGYTAAGKLLLENRVDAAYGATTSTVFQEIQHAPGGIRCIEMPSANKEAWRRVTKACPAHLPASNPKNYGIEAAWGKELASYPNAEYTYLNQDERIAYSITRAWFEGFETYKKVAATLKTFNPKVALDCLNQPLPYHPGSVKFFKEKNVWTPEHEKWQKQQMDNQELRIKAWESAVKEAESKGIKIARNNEKWLDLWKSYLNKL